MQVLIIFITVGSIFIDFFCMGQTLGHRDEPSAFLAAKCLLIDALHHVRTKARAVAEDHVRVCPVVLVDIAKHHVESRRSAHWPAKDLLVIVRLNLCQIGIIDSFQIDGDVLKRL